MVSPETRCARSSDVRIARFFSRLAAFSRLILFDKRGTGLSDRDVGVATLEERMDDVRAVMDAAGSESAALYGVSEGGPMNILFAATYPRRVRSLILYGSYTGGIGIALTELLARGGNLEHTLRRIRVPEATAPDRTTRPLERVIGSPLYRRRSVGYGKLSRRLLRRLATAVPI